MLQTTAILNFLKPKKVSTAIKAATQRAASYIDTVINTLTTLSVLEKENRQATEQEIELLNKFDGYGKVTKALNNNHERYAELKEAFDSISPQAHDSAKRGVLTSYFTNDTIVNAMWRSVLRLGVQEGIAIEPSVGNGAFIKNAPSQFDGRFHAIELDKVSADICKATTASNCKVYNDRYENVKLPNNQYSLAIGNPPYGAIPARSREFGKVNILPYFMLRSLRELHNGGVMAFVVSSWFMDSEDTSIRELVADSANLIATVRLPSNQFDKKGASGVTTDIVIFQKTETPIESPVWVNTADKGDWRINEIFEQKPELIIGELQAPNDFSFATCTVKEPQNFEQVLNDTLDAQTAQPVFFRPTVNKDIKQKEVVQVCLEELSMSLANNELFEENGKVFLAHVTKGQFSLHSDVTATEQEFTSKTVQGRFLAYIEVKDALKALLLAEEKYNEDEPLKQLRMDLNVKHQAFVKKYGALSRSSNKSKLRQCSMFLRTRALELNYTAAIKAEDIKESFDTAQILNKRVYKTHEAPTSAKNTTEASIISVLEKGVIVPKYLGTLLDCDSDTAVKRCIEDSVMFLNPETETYELATTYLSGNIYKKIEAVIAKDNANLYGNNLTALENVKPTPLAFEDIKVSFGATWTGNEVYQEFLVHLLGENTKADVRLIHGKWEINLTGGNYQEICKWKTEDKSFEDIFVNLINTKPIIVRKTDSIGTFVDRQATFEANEKADEMLNVFEDWLPTSAQRRIRLTDNYNRIMNAYVVPCFEEVSKHITIDNCTMTPRPHQRRAIARSILTPASLGDMAVGSGKTLTLQSIVMKLKEIHGVGYTSVIAMPNPLVEQFSTTFLETFPSANILTIPDKTPPKMREELLNLAMTGDFDCIVMPETTLKALEAPRETTQYLLDNEIVKLREAYEEANNYNIDTRAQKRLERMIEKKEEQLEELMDKPELESITYDDLKVDFLAFDEAQAVKNLNFFTNMSGVRGLGNPTGSKRAYDFFVKARHTLMNGGNTFLCTGTTISNSITEIVTWLRMLEQDFMTPEILQVDSFIKTFAAPQTDLEIDGTGRNLKMTTSLKRFQNLPELLRVYRTIAEVISLEQLKNQLPPLEDGRPAIPPFAGGQIKTEILKISPEQNEFFLTLVNMAKSLTKSNNMLKIMDLARKASLDLRHIDPELRTENNVCDKAVENIMKLYNDSRAYNGTQVVFCDRSISMRHRVSERAEWTNLFNKAESGDIDAIKRTKGLTLEKVLETASDGFSLYDELERRLTDFGLKVAIVHDYHTDALKRKLKAMVNKGEIDVVIGSTMKLGTGFNINERLIGLHNLDLPLRSGDYFQRLGRIERQNSKAYIEGHYDEVHAFNYCTERTLDSWFLNLLNKKNDYIVQFTNGSLNGSREYEPEHEVIDFASLSAIVTGNDDFIELAKSRLEVKKLQSKRRSVHSRVSRAHDNIDFCSKEIVHLNEIMPTLTIDQEAAIDASLVEPEFKELQHLDEKVHVNFRNALQFARSKINFRTQNSVDVCTFGDFTLTVGYEKSRMTYNLVNKHQHEVVIRGYHTGATALYNAVERRIQSIQNIASSTQKQIAVYESTLAHAKTDVTLTFDHDDRIDELHDRINVLETAIAEREDKEREDAREAKAKEQA